MIMKFSNGYNDEENYALSIATGLSCDPEDDHTVQSDADDCNINTIVRRYNATGLAPRNTATPFFADLSEQFDFQASHDLVESTKESFLALPSDVRERFANNPANLAQFLDDPNNRSEAARLGLFRPEVAKAILAPPPVEPPPTPTPQPDPAS